MALDRRAELGEFLRSRRARLRPEDAGLHDYGGRRRVPGLRREELALLAGVSVDHYVRLEQGRTLHFSEAVLDAVARALRLDEVERGHLYRLARPWSEADHSREEASRSQRVRPGLRRLLDSAADVPAYVVGRNTDVLAWNGLAAALITDFGALPPRRRNLARLVFLDEGMRSLYADWRGKAGDVAAYLRLDAGRHPGDPDTVELIEELSAAGPEFREVWAEHRLKDKTHGRYLYRHPVVGELDLGFETLRLPDDPDQALVAHTVEEGSPSETALRLLAVWTRENTPVDGPRGPEARAVTVRPVRPG
ncbi:helix-turn-helix transcriptional regulator [Streptomyces sp. NPDC016469]|uniref:helix-turn-helix transcriptional regulator n=1 Tax=Streptomyces sp. NPDC016469 TaxID=3157191 RepID=UPI0033E456FA